MSTDQIPRLNEALRGRYRVEQELGEGGMAQVYLADDFKHERQVALKVLKPELAAVIGTDRFLAEIRTTANLQHPHILPLFDSGEADGLLFYVMPYLAGETLRDRLDRERQLPVDEAVRVAVGMAEGLDYAHRQGVIHRDIKPANVLLQDGKPVISDFGIALAVSAGGGDRLTETGLSLGTPHYMSPEQATGDSSVGPAADIWAVGCVLYEMLVGEPPFTGSTPQAVLGRIIAGDVPSASGQRKSIPGNVDAVIGRALEKIPADRFRSAGELVGGLEDPAFRNRRAGVGAGGGDAKARWGRAAIPVVWAAVATLVAGWLGLMPDEPTPLVRYIQDFPPGEEPALGATSAFAVSPDGHLLVYSGPGARLWLRERGEPSGRPIEGTEAGLQPTFSPDGRQLAFVTAQGQLRAVSLDGGPSRTLVESNVRRLGAAWAPDGFVYFTLEPSLGLHRVTASVGGQPEQLTRLDSSRGEVQHGWPEALPAGHGVLFTTSRSAADSEIAVLDEQGEEGRPITTGRTPRYADSGHLLFTRSDGSLYAAPFDQVGVSLTGPEVLIINGLEPSVDFDISLDGRLVFGASGTQQLLWVSRDGSENAIDSAGLTGANPDISPDGTKVAVSFEGDIWIKDLPAGPRRQLTFDGRSTRPAWDPSGEMVTFVSGPDEVQDLYQRRADGSEGPQLLLHVDRRIVQAITSPDGSSWVFRLGVGDDRDLFWARRDVREPQPLRASAAAAERAPTISPDGRWVAYVSDESGQDEIYVIGFPEDEDGPTRVSSDGGAEPLWSHGGTELFYVSASNFMTAVDVTAGETFFVGGQAALFSTGRYSDDPNHRSFDVSPDDQLFMMQRAQAGGTANRLTVFENYHQELRRLVGN